ncbi:MAG TPA: biopolymer transporter ExbD, partial [Gemmatimonadales bacterium]|nr:biopolymer transporter ExbD [Gemmatimonadales bacterium]
MPRVSIAPEADLSTDINVLPLIDILLVLIIIFLVAVKREFYIPAQVPPPASGGSVTGGQLVLQLRADGSMTLNQQPIPAGQLEVQLRAAFANRPAKLLFVDVAPELYYQDAITATDVAREAGVEVVAWVPH